MRKTPLGTDRSPRLKKGGLVILFGHFASLCCQFVISPFSRLSNSHLTQRLSSRCSKSEPLDAQIGTLHLHKYTH